MGLRQPEFVSPGYTPFFFEVFAVSSTALLEFEVHAYAGAPLISLLTASYGPLGQDERGILFATWKLNSLIDHMTVTKIQVYPFFFSTNPIHAVFHSPNLLHTGPGFHQYVIDTSGPPT